MEQVISIVQMTFLNAVREKFYRGLFFLLVFFLILAYYLTLLSLTEPYRIFLEVGFLSILSFNLLLILYFAIFEFRRMMEGKGIQLFLAKPIRREVFLLGYFLGIGCVVWIFTLLSALSLQGVFALLFRQWIAGFWVGLALILLQVTLFTAMGVFFATLFSSTMVSTFSFFALFVVGYTTREAYELTVKYGKPVSQAVTKFLLYFLPSFDYYDLSPIFLYGEVMGWKPFTLLTFYSFFYTGVFLLAAFVLFHLKEVE